MFVVKNDQRTEIATRHQQFGVAKELDRSRSHRLHGWARALEGQMLHLINNAQARKRSHSCQMGVCGVLLRARGGRGDGVTAGGD